MSDDMRLLILTHLRAAMERKDRAAVQRALATAHRYGDTKLADQLYAALYRSSWAALEGIYVALGGMGSGEPGKRPGGTEKARDGVCGGVVA